MVGKHKGNHGFGNRYHARRNCGVMPSFDRDFSVFSGCEDQLFAELFLWKG